MRLKCHAAKFPMVAFPKAKFNAGKMSYDGISSCKISCGEIYRDENFRGKNVMRRNFWLRNLPRQTYHCKNVLISTTPNTNIFKIIENLIIIIESKRFYQFLQHFMFFKEKLVIS